MADTKAKKATTKKAEVKKTAPKKAVKATLVKANVKKDNKTMKRTLSGTVVSVKMQNTVVVAIERKVAHKLYRKLIKVTKRIKADTNGMEIKEGDRVKIESTRPISRDKNFKVIGKEEAK